MSIIIDGSVLEAGGQILRNTISLSALLKKPVSINNIRKARIPPGLKNQHRTGIQLAAEIAAARLAGATNGSMTISFEPGQISLPGNFVANSVTAGSTTLLLQIALPLLLFATASGSPTPSTLVLLGGTNASQAPQIDYTQHIFLPFMRQHFGLGEMSEGPGVSLEVRKRGYFPKGGGEVHVTVKPFRGKPLTAARLLERGRVKHIKGISHFAGLPMSVGQEMVLGARQRLAESLNELGDQSPITIDIHHRRERNEDTTGAGSGIVLWAELEGGGVIGGSALGRKGIDPRLVGQEAADELLRGILADGVVDEWLQDQVIIFMALAKGKSEIKCGKSGLALHTRTAIWVAQQMTDAVFEVEELPSGHTVIRCQGIGYTAPD